MDTSEEYVEMCRGAMKYLWFKNYHFRIGSLFFRENYKNIFPIAWAGRLENLKEDLVVPIWQQDQLQDMVDWDNYHDCQSTVGKTDEFWWWCHPKTKTNDYDWEKQMIDYIWSFNTMEQLWLAFVMWEKYQKRWDGVGWIK
jgi:hypothetical protein